MLSLTSKSLITSELAKVTLPTAEFLHSIWVLLLSLQNFGKQKVELHECRLFEFLKFFAAVDNGFFALIWGLKTKIYFC